MWKSTLWTLWMILIRIPSSSCIWCYECFTSDPEGQCVTRPSLPDAECRETSCLKTVMYYPNGTLMSLSRTCTSIEMPSYCSAGQFGDDTDLDTSRTPSIDVKICTYFCSRNYCNAAHSVRNAVTTFIAIKFLVFLSLFN